MERFTFFVICEYAKKIIITKIGLKDYIMIKGFVGVNGWRESGRVGWMTKWMNGYKCNASLHCKLRRTDDNKEIKSWKNK